MSRKISRKEKLAREKRRQVQHEARSAGKQIVRRKLSPPTVSSSGNHTSFQSLYPKFVFEPNDAPVEFVELVKRACAAIDFDDRSRFSATEAEAYRLVRSEGGYNTRWSIATVLQNAHGVENPLVHQVYCDTNLGNQVFSLIPPEKLARFIPHNDVFIQPIDRVIHVYFRSLRRVSSPWGTVYHSKHKPTVEVD